ncbi:MAG: hypothetical protein QM775_16535 [Pirellulales bacterium]
MRVETPRRLTPGATFTIDEARSIVAAACRLANPASRAEWVARCCAMFYAGLRIGSVEALDAAMFQTRGERRWCVVDGDDVKTGNALAVPVHAEFGAAVDRLKVSTGRLFSVIDRRWLARQHEKLQLEAGIKKPLGFHAWRRTYTEQMALVGAGHGELAAQAGADHANARTTREHYCNAKALLVDRLPRLMIADGLDQKRLAF